MLAHEANIDLILVLLGLLLFIAAVLQSIALAVHLKDADVMS